MTRTCFYCAKSIDSSHDEHYYCKCEGTYTAVCLQDHLSNPDCPRCGKPLKHREDSYQKKPFNSPGGRGLLGF